MRQTCLAGALIFLVTVVIGMEVSCGGVSPPGAATGAGGGGAGTSGAPTGAGGTGGSAGGAGTGGGETTVARASFLYSGAVDNGPVNARREISAPILPRTTVIYAPFPADLAGEKTMAHDAALTFEWLLPRCAPMYPRITLDASGGGALSPAQLATNYDEVGRCAYEQYVAKPYWIPKLIDDVDICGTELGAGWRLITEADLRAMQETDYQAVSDLWRLTSLGGTSGFGDFFATLQVWVRADDGTIKAGTLEPNAGADRVRPLQLANGFGLTDHYEGGLGLRCIRGTN